MTIAKKQRITVGNLVKLRECAEKFKFTELTMGSNELERRFHIRDVLALLKQNLSSGIDEQTATKSIMEKLVSGYKSEWFVMDAEKETVLKKDSSRISRLVSFMYEKHAKMTSDVPYVLEMPSISYRGRTFQQISGKADLILEYEDGRYEAIMFSQKEPQYSYAARREDNKPANAIELICMKLGLESRYPGITCSIYYLKNKDDKGFEFKRFEHKPGKNIVSQGFESYTTCEDLFRHLYDVVALPVNKSCERCIFCDVCRFPRSIRTETPVMHRKVDSVKESGKTQMTEKQRKVIEHVNGPMNVLAVPGAGKTFSLVQRMLHLIKEVGIKPSKILFVTFTKKACEEIKQRVECALGTTDENKLPNIYTFNALGYQILKDNPSLIGRRVKLADTIDRLSIIREALDMVPRIKGVSYEGLYMPFGLIRRLEKEFNNISRYDNLEEWQEKYKGDAEGVLRVYHKYMELFEARELVTYDMQKTLCIELFENRPDLAKIYSRVFSYIMVDEFQDASAEDVKLVYTIAKYHNNIVVVGDDDQSIYSFRGGSNQYILNFAQEFPEAETVIMNDNFRSNDKILEASESLIRNNQERLEKHIMPHLENAYRPILLRNFLPQRLPQLVKDILNKGYSLDDIAILGRYNKTLFGAADVLSSVYPCNSPKDYLVEDAVFLAIYDVLALYCAGSEVDRSVYRLFSLLGCEKYLVKTMREQSLMQNVLEAVGLPMMDLTSAECANFYKNILGDNELQLAAVKIFNALKEIQYAASVQSAIEGIVGALFGIEHPVVKVLQDMVDERGVDNIRKFYFILRDMVLFKDEKRVGYQSSNDRINLLTAHDAKGKEFPVVIVYSAEDFSDSEEERRLMYVAMTRAKNTLFLTEGEYATASLLHECESKMAVY